MIIKPIIKKGVKDVTWLDEFVKSRLNGDATHEAICTDKMYYALSKYCRKLDYHAGSKFSIATGLFFNNGIYTIEVNTHTNKNMLYITDVEKATKENILHRHADYVSCNKGISQKEIDDYLKYFEADETYNFNPFHSNFVESLYKTLFNEHKIFHDLIDDYL